MRRQGCSALVLCALIGGLGCELGSGSRRGQAFDLEIANAEEGLAEGGAAPQLSFDPGPLDFGEVTAGERLVRSLRLRNDTELTETIRVAARPEFPGVFGVLDAAGADLAPGAALSVLVEPHSQRWVRVWFQPFEAGVATSSLSLSLCERSACLRAVRLRGTGIKPSFRLRPLAVELRADQVLGSTTAEAIIENTGKDRLNLRSLSLVGPGRSRFHVVPRTPLPVELPPGAALRLAVRLDAGEIGTATAAAIITTDAFDPPATVAHENLAILSLRGVTEGPVIAASAPALDFGHVPPGARRHQAVSVANHGNAPLSISGLELLGDTAELSFFAVPALPAVVEPGASVELVLNYLPKVLGPGRAALLVSSDDPAQPLLRISVQGVGDSSPECAVACLP